jgi:hypothetical protein
MEPVFMVLGQSAATAAVHAIEQQTTIQQINYPKLQSATACRQSNARLRVEISNQGTNGHVIADAVQFLPVETVLKPAPKGKSKGDK